jgi:hypothetical protein
MDGEHKDITNVLCDSFTGTAPVAPEFDAAPLPTTNSSPDSSTITVLNLADQQLVQVPSAEAALQPPAPTTADVGLKRPIGTPDSSPLIVSRTKQLKRQLHFRDDELPHAEFPELPAVPQQAHAASMAAPVTDLNSLAQLFQNGLQGLDGKIGNINTRLDEQEKASNDRFTKLHDRVGNLLDEHGQELIAHDQRIAHVEELTKELETPCWTLGSWNIGGVHAKLRDIDIRLHLAGYDVILFQETQTIRDFTFPSHDVWHIPGVRNEARGRPSGGLAILTRKQFNWTMTKLTTNDSSHFQACVLTLGEIS